MGKHKMPLEQLKVNHYRPEKVSIGIELVKLPSPMPDVVKNKEAYQFYQYLGGELIASNKLATTDIFTLQVFCLELADYFELRRQLNGEWAIKTGTIKETANPVARLAMQKLAEVKAFGKELGLTPYSRGMVGKVIQIANMPDAKEDLDLD